MRLLLPASLELSLPVTISEELGDGGPRLGGRAPEGIQPAAAWAPTLRYFASLPLAIEPELLVSIFLSFTLDEMFSAAGDVILGSKFVHVMVHEPRPRAADDAFASDLSPHSLLIGAAREDSVAEETGEVIRSSHKIGGRPYFMHGEHDLEKAIAELEKNGFRQVVQFDFPGSADATVDGTWPFGDGVFHLLGREPFGMNDWRAFWEN